MPEEVKRYYEPSPTLERFHHCDDMVRGILGPTGSGKSVGCVMEGYFRSMEQAPAKDGVRYTRGLCVRNTYPQLRSTTIKTWEVWMPQAPVIYGTPITWHWKRKDIGDGTGVDMEVMFLSLDTPKDVAKLKSLEVTWIWINEASEIVEDILTWAINRCGRYPDKQVSPLTWSGVFMDTNSVDQDHWWYKKAEVEKPVSWTFFRQPPALRKLKDTWTINPACENRTHQTLGDNYWLKQIPGHNDEWIRIYLCAEYGATPEGKPVYPEYSDHRHYSETALVADGGLPLWLGWDASGRNPAVVITQLNLKGQLRVLDEICGQDIGIRQFARDVVRPFLAGKYPGMPIRSVGDPAGVKKQETDDRTCFLELEQAGFPIIPARSNTLTARREAVAGYLLRNVEGDQPAFLLSSTCKMLRAGFLGKYYFRRIFVNFEKYHDEPEKNMYSHPHDGLQYVAEELEAPRISAESANRSQGARKIKQVKYAW